MTESLWFEANDDKAAELDRLASQLGTCREDLLNEAVDLLLAAHRSKRIGEEPIGILAGLHEVMHRLRIIVDELLLIRFTTSTGTSIFSDLKVDDKVCERLSHHYQTIYEASERALAAAGFGPMLAVVIENYDPYRSDPALKD